MPELSFQVEGAEPVPYAAVPLIALKLSVANSNLEEQIHTIALRVQILLEVTRRQYDPNEQDRMSDLFGSPDRWGQTLRSMLWTHVSVVVPRFVGSTLTDLCVPCSFDFNIAATKYFYALTSGEIPLCLQFSGTTFYQGENQELQVAPIPWDKETKFRLPVNAWKALMEQHYPNCAWLSIRRDVFDRLYQYKVKEGLPTWEEALERALAATREEVHS